MDKWEDTVMKYTKIHSLWEKWLKDTHNTVVVYQLDCYKTMAEAQAKDTWDVSFKAGEDKGKQESKQEGIKLVVDFLESHHCGLATCDMEFGMLSAFLKERLD